MPNGTRPKPVDPARLAASALQSFDGPLVLAQFETVGLTTVLGEYGRNGRVRTYATPDERTLAFNDGIVVSSRGLGNDLMSSDIGETARIVRSRQSGKSNRKYRFLDGEGIERPLPMSCRILPAGSETLEAGGQRVNVTRVQETCQTAGGGLTITNSYWVTGNGAMLASRQWIGPALGYVTIQVLRP
ncbi:YjbF family lipoprotein [Albidovulum inexpectatum]|nr:YjbF family lipoprotein [Albidovulum inexpectatum]